MAYDLDATRRDIREAVNAQRSLDGTRQMNYSQMVMSNRRLQAAGKVSEAATMYLYWIKIQGWA